MSEGLPPKKPSAVPPDRPDPAAEAERSDLARPKGPTPTEEVRSLRADQVARLDRLIASRDGEIEQCRVKIEARGVEVLALTSRCATLEALHPVATRLTHVATGLTVLGPTLIGVVGNLAAIPPEWKIALTAIGLAVAFLGAALPYLAWGKGKAD